MSDFALKQIKFFSGKYFIIICLVANEESSMYKFLWNYLGMTNGKNLWYLAYANMIDFSEGFV
jgi:hypothetical protein